MVAAPTVLTAGAGNSGLFSTEGSDAGIIWKNIGKEPPRRKEKTRNKLKGESTESLNEKLSVLSFVHPARSAPGPPRIPSAGNAGRKQGVRP